MKIETNKVIGKTFTVPQLMEREGLRRGVPRRRRRRPHLPRHPGRVRRPGLLGQRVPHPREPHGRRPVPLPRHPGERRAERGGHRRRQHRHGLPARLEAHRRRHGPLRLPPHRGRGPGPHRGDPPRQGGGHRVLLPPRAGRDLHRRRGQRARHEGRGDAARRSGREGAPQARSHRPLQGPPVRHGHLRARHQGQPHHHPVHPGARPQQVGQHRGRRQGPGHHAPRRLRRR